MELSAEIDAQLAKSFSGAKVGMQLTYVPVHHQTEYQRL